jgi:tetratricopeptide (TPR) repeat protein
MNISKYITLLFAQFLLFSFCIAQKEIIQEQAAQIYKQHTAQRVRIDSLKIILRTASDTAKINCLNKLSREYYLFNTDTAWNCAMEAYNMAVKINFKKGKAEGLLNLAQITQERGDISGAEKYFRQVPDLYKETDDLKEYNNAIAILGYNLYLQLKFYEARTLKEKNLTYYKTVADDVGLAYTYRVIGKTYEEQGYYEKAFEYFHKDMLITRKIEEYKGTRRDQYMWGNYYMADLYKDAGDSKTALSYYRLSAERAKENELPDFYNSRMGDINFLLHNYDSARYYYQLEHDLISLRFVDPVLRKNFLSDADINIGETYLAQNKYDEALEHILKPLQFCFPPNLFTMRVLNDLARVYKGQKKITQSFQYSKQLLAVAQTNGARQYIRDGFELYWKLYDQQGKTDSAYKYHLLYSTMKDSLARDVQLRNMAAIEMKFQNEQQQSKISLLNKEKKIQEQQNQILFLGFIGLILTGIVVFRNILLKRRNEINMRKGAEKELQIQELQTEKTKAEFQQQAAELEMQALRAQMNPHFIFNSLNSINRFILQNNKAQASEYLTKFSKLVRLILQNSQSALIPLDSELESLQLYLELEAVRFDHHFEFNIKVDNELETDIIKVPPLIIQPYAENAIWHGLMHKEEKGNLEIELFQQDDFLCCKITDDGVGRKKATEIKSKSAATHKSMGMQITASRIEMLQQKKQLDTYIKITDLVLPDGSEGGTEVLLKIPVSYD